MKLAPISLILLIAIVGAFGTSYATEDEDCLSCHGDGTLTDDAGGSVYVDPEGFSLSVHGEEGVGCVGCHTDLEGVEDFPHRERLEAVNCGLCHDGAYEDYAESLHGVLSIERGDQDAPSCASCHGAHDIRRKDDLKSRVSAKNIPETCSKCHTDERMMAEHSLAKGPSFVKVYQESVHGRALTEAGLTVSAVCNDCHGAHDIKHTKDPQSRVWRTHIPKTCAKCHGGIYETYAQSVHGRDFLAGNPDVPTCTDCHGEHTIRSHLDPKSSVYATHVAYLCSKCHDDEQLNKVYGLPSKRLVTFIGSYHGVASEFRDMKVANCASCHGVHDIRPSSDPLSLIHPDNLQRTCGKCHPQAGVNFARGKIHIEESRESSIIAHLVEKFYTVFIAVLVGGFLMFIGIDLIGRWRRRSVGSD